MAKKKPKSNYWDRRAEEERKWQEKNLAEDATFARLVKSYYDNVIIQINKDIDHNYQLLAKAVGGLNNAYSAVSSADMAAYEVEAQKVVMQADQMRAAGKHHISYSDFSDEVNRHMKVYNATMRINRLEYLKSQVGLHLTEANMAIDDSLRVKLSDDYLNEVKRQAGILGKTVQYNVAAINDQLPKIVMAQTAGATFSQRIWANQDALKAQLDQVLSYGLITGQSNQAMARHLKHQVRDTINNNRYVTERLARTESARVQYKAQIDSIEAADYKYVKWYAEPGACRVCQEINDNDEYDLGYGVFPVDEAPQIPVHANCRCSISAYWVDGKNNLNRDTHYNDVDPSLYQEHTIPVSYKPYSVAAKLANQKEAQYRTFDKVGNPRTDYDLTNHGSPKYHPVVPHAHDWLVIKDKDKVKYKRAKKWRKLNNAERKNIERWLKSHERK